MEAKSMRIKTNERPNTLKDYLKDDFLSSLLFDIKQAGGMKSCLVDMTHKCNLRCEGCYFFVEGMDHQKKVETEAEFDAFIQSELQRGTNMVTALGGEPALEIARLKKLTEHFQVTTVTNGTLEIPYDDLKELRIAVSFWGDKVRDKELRGNGKRDIFSQAKANFKNDPRVVWYYTIVPGFTEGVEEATREMIENGNFVTYNFYGDLADLGGRYSHTEGFKNSIDIIDRMIAQYPDKIVSSPHINNTISSRHLFGKKWGYEVCPNVTFDHPENLERVKTGKSYGNHFKAYNADLASTRRCCVGNARDCDTCTDLWAFYGWVVGSMKAHLKNKGDFTQWLCTTYMFYLKTGFIDLQKGAKLLPEMHRRMALASEPRIAPTEAIDYIEMA